ncbi:uncharacterized protein LOC114910162 isoform X2 [Scleropages formosus]|uniref:uncharacterized protein LOC114910162 isoform X2 n=1 Tax=Scleropages formosus TaxID=113540 RepID=UPI0010FAB380|nr:uncharacterized protein LOC114910162 isoform X2 [Scleropages formosus]
MRARKTLRLSKEVRSRKAEQGSVLDFLTRTCSHRKPSYADAMSGSRVSGGREERMLFQPNVAEEQVHAEPGAEKEHLTLFAIPVTSPTKAQGTPRTQTGRGVKASLQKVTRRAEERRGYAFYRKSTFGTSGMWPYSPLVGGRVDRAGVWVASTPQHLKATLPADSQAPLEAPITLGELSEVLSKVNQRKVPGLDRLPVEFYSTFWDVLGPVFLEVLEEVLTQALLPSGSSPVTPTPAFRRLWVSFPLRHLVNSWSNVGQRPSLCQTTTSRW